MKINNLILSVFIIVISDLSFSDNIDVMFFPDSENECLVSGKTNDSNEFKATSENAPDVIALVKNWIEKGFTGSLEADMTNYDTGITEHLFFYGHYDDEGNFEAHAIRPNAHVIKWKETSIPPSDEDLTVSD